MAMSVLAPTLKQSDLAGISLKIGRNITFLDYSEPIVQYSQVCGLKEIF